MKKWKAVIEHNNKIKVLVVSGERYSDVYIDLKADYVGSTILSITEITPDNETNDILPD